MPRKSKDIYLKYKHEALVDAIQAIQTGNVLWKASKTFCIPKSTLVGHVKGKVSGSPGKNPFIPIEMENLIVEKVLKLAEEVLGISKKHMMRKVRKVAKKDLPSEAWWKGFKGRHPEISIRKPEKLSTCRSRMMNRVVVSNLFSKIAKLINDTQLTSDVIWNTDETEKQFEHSPRSVISIGKVQYRCQVEHPIPAKT